MIFSQKNVKTYDEILDGKGYLIKSSKFIDLYVIVIYFKS
jgi:hypothetical protein